ncbi:MAG TPA: CBS domain-containing protein [Actinophytocola sp.]|jgi:CBS domain-containing protein|uniref:CBS domain-containing protein n=1 Tax=Actinophytocola sp. TaxID=1872138 RepID=UPI002E05FEC7|nr:CBS domain-containing protein [Actinophytocola sp.]
MTTQLSATTVASMMAPNPVGVRPHTPVKEVLELLAERNLGAVPVVSATGLLAGEVSEADLLRAKAKRRGTRRWTAGELMTSPAVSVRPGASLSQATRALVRSGRHQLYVADGGRLVGVLTRSDLLSVFLRPDKEIQADVEHELGDAVRVSVDAGVVQLTGRQPGGQAPALSRIAAIPGVIDIRDRRHC